MNVYKSILYPSLPFGHTIIAPFFFNAPLDLSATHREAVLPTLGTTRLGCYTHYVAVMLSIPSNVLCPWVKHFTRCLLYTAVSKADLSHLYTMEIQLLTHHELEELIQHYRWLTQKVNFCEKQYNYEWKLTWTELIIVLRAKTVAQSRTVERLSNAPWVSMKITAT